MSAVGLGRGLAGFGAGLGRGRGVSKTTNHGRQGKSAAFGRAQVVGRIEDFDHIQYAPCWRFRRNCQRFQCSERHRPLQQGRIHP